MVRWRLEAAGVGPEAGPAAAAVQAAVLDRRSRSRRSSDSGCEVEAVVAAAGGMREEGGRGRSLLAWLLTGCPAGAEGAQRRAGLDSGRAEGFGCGKWGKCRRRGQSRRSWSSWEQSEK